ncbi:MAG: maltose alpha-D-glucosyltransferase [Chloroflexota bacterium]
MNSIRSLWYKQAVFYEVYVRAFYDSNGDGHGDLKGLIQKLDYLKDFGVDCIWLLPIYPSPLRDDGYDIADYYNVLPTYGDLNDFKELVRQAHQRGMRVIADLVMNHTSDQHPWFQSARSSRTSPYRDYYVWSDTDQKYKDARIIFLDTEKSNWTWDEVAGQYYWHRFYSSQPDLNYDNPAVREEMKKIIHFWMDMGIDGFRADAVPYLFEREGTNCENLPETHAYLKEVRAYLDEHYPDAILLGEANQWPEDVLPYFGNGDELHMNFHFPLMPRLYMALKKEDKAPLEWVFERTPAIPENCQWCTFLRNHDELTLEMVTPEEREFMWREYAPDPKMRLNLGIRRRLAPLLDNDQRRIRLLYSMLFSFPGTPIIYYGDEIGMGDNIELFDRNGVRTPMQWDSSPTAGFSSAPPSQWYAPVISVSPFDPVHVNVADQIQRSDSLYHYLKHLIALRKSRFELAGGEMRWIETGSPLVAAVWRAEGDRWLCAVHNLANRVQEISLDLPVQAGILTDLIEGKISINPAEGHLKIQPYQTLWFASPQV